MRKEKNLRTDSFRTEQHFFNDICSTCNSNDICVSKKTKQGAIWFCEEFDDYTPVKELYDTAFQPKGSQVIDTRGDDSRQFKGLCSNCEIRHTCNYTKTNGGVWHCEEYQ